jgi:hypothetical protein
MNDNAALASPMSSQSDQLYTKIPMSLTANLNADDSHSTPVAQNNCNCPEPNDNTVQPSLPKKDVTYWQGVCLVISREIGAGIFSTPAIVNGNAGSVGLSLILWTLAGGLAYTGACKFPYYSLY